MELKFITLSKGAAKEYSEYSFNSHTGCTNGCSYCYLKGLGMNHPPKPKKMLYDRDDNIFAAYKFVRCRYEPELEKLLEADPELREKGILLSFATDPLLEETLIYTKFVVIANIEKYVITRLLTKRGVKEFQKFANFALDLDRDKEETQWQLAHLHYGVTLTGFDDLEPNAAPNMERIETLKLARENGFATWVSLEPIIDFETSLNMLKASKDFVFYYKIGLQNRGIKYAQDTALWFKSQVEELLPASKFTFKNSFKKLIGIE